ncbi:double-strand break repair helicase AddA [soil metagenome]
MSAPAYQADGRPVTRQAFYALACDPQRSVVVEACAGAGKTWMLVSRILRALLDGAQPHEILAITFTRKAAGEMRQRLDEWLREFASPHTSDDDRTRELIARGVSPAEASKLAPRLATLHEQVLCSGRPVEIRTFHAWFSQLLRAAPLELLAELGLQPDMDLIEDLDDHRPEVYRRFHAALLRDASLLADHATLIEHRGRSQARKWFDAGWDKRVEFELADAAGVLDHSVPPPDGAALDDDGRPHPAEALQTAAWREILRELAILLGAGGVKAQDAATGLVMALAEPHPKAMFDAAWSALFTEKGTPRKQLGKVAQLAGVQDELALIEARIRQHHAHLEHRRMVRLVRVLLAEYAGYKRTRGLADMADLESCALALLRDATLSGWVQERLDARIRHLLIDEFQDTSPLQWHALHAWLSAYAGAGGGVSGQRPPGVFIVGDPKQSIYRFRRAEPKVFEAAQGFVVEALGGTMLACDHTRRNAPEVLNALNAVFERASAEQGFGGFRPHTTELAPVAGAGMLALPPVPRPPRLEKGTEIDEPVWRDTLSTPRHEPEEVLRAQEATLVAQAIHELVTVQQVHAADIMVLCRKRQSLRLVAQALRRLHLPYAAVEDFELMQAPEARDLVALLDVLASPQHKLSLAQTLRSPLFGASDDDLIDLSERASAHGGDWWRALTRAEVLPAPDAIEAGSPDPSGAQLSPVMMRARSLLLRWQTVAAQLPPHDVLDRIVAEGDLRERVAATVPPEQRVAALDAIDAVMGLALTLDGARYATPYNFVRALKRRAVKVAAPAQPGAVQLLTVHGAKGLEARVVFVMDADPEAGSTQTATLLVEWPVHSQAPVRCAFVYSEAQCPPMLEPMLDEEMAARHREELNGLYVAMSRAKQRLVFSATEPRRRVQQVSWWQRIEALAVPWAPALERVSQTNLHRSVPLGEASADRDAAASASPSAWAAPSEIAAVPPATLKLLPVWRVAGEPAVAAPTVSGGSTLPKTPPGVPDTPQTLLGKSVHRVLEWATAAGISAASAELVRFAEAAAAEFATKGTEVARIARGILASPDCARFFGGSSLRWAGNEVPVSEGGEQLRIDRLVLLDDAAGTPAWWVLDYKLQHAPEQLAEYREQLLRYRRAVSRVQPDAAVRCAFITGQGGVVEITA